MTEIAAARKDTLPELLWHLIHEVDDSDPFAAPPKTRAFMAMTQGAESEVAEFVRHIVEDHPRDLDKIEEIYDAAETDSSLSKISSLKAKIRTELMRQGGGPVTPTDVDGKTTRIWAVRNFSRWAHATTSERAAEFKRNRKTEKY
jgi:hypothetical protein